MEDGELHFSVKGLLSKAGLPYTRDNEEMAVRDIRQVAKEVFPEIPVDELIQRAYEEGREMQATLVVKCEQCEKNLGQVRVDTADMPDQLQAKVNKIILNHRSECKF